MVVSWDYLEDGSTLYYRIPDALVLASASKWDNNTLLQLKVYMVKCSEEAFLNMLGIADSDNEKAKKLRDDLQSIKNGFDDCYHDPAWYEHLRDEEPEFAVYKLPIVKALLLMLTYSTHESNVDALVRELLHALGFYDEMLFPMQRLRLPLRFGDVEKESKADFYRFGLIDNFLSIGHRRRQKRL